MLCFGSSWKQEGLQVVHRGSMPSQTPRSPRGAQLPLSCACVTGHGLVLLALTVAFVQLSPKLCPQGITTLTQKGSLTPSSSRWGRGMGRVVPPHTMPTGQVHSAVGTGQTQSWGTWFLFGHAKLPKPEEQQWFVFWFLLPDLYF